MGFVTQGTPGNEGSIPLGGTPSTVPDNPPGAPVSPPTDTSNLADLYQSYLNSLQTGTTGDTAFITGSSTAPHLGGTAPASASKAWIIAAVIGTLVVWYLYAKHKGTTSAPSAPEKKTTLYVGGAIVLVVVLYLYAKSKQTAAPTLATPASALTTSPTVTAAQETAAAQLAIAQGEQALQAKQLALQAQTKP